MNEIQIGHLLRGSTGGFVAGCRLSKFETDAPSFGSLVRVPVAGSYETYGMIYDIHIDDDGLVRQLVTAESVDQNTIADNRENRTVPVEISVLVVGYRLGERIYHLLPPRPPLSLDVIYLCSQVELCDFTAAGHFGYFRHILRATDLPVGELLAAHLQQAHAAHQQGRSLDWQDRATQEIITLLRDDYPTLISVLGALADAFVDFRF
jgi:hypothetical protein